MFVDSNRALIYNFVLSSEEKRYRTCLHVGSLSSYLSEEIHSVLKFIGFEIKMNKNIEYA